jgi:two-component system nitrogen regulation sensor histidine kinase NtrY
LLRKNGQTLRLISIQDIRQEMEAKEVESYRKLISVLTHEIMNLISPVTSVTKSLLSLFVKNGIPVNVQQLDEDALITTQRGLQLINDQSYGLTSFIENYRKISRLPQPVIQLFDVNEWLDQLRIVFADTMHRQDIRFRISGDKIKSISADKNLLNQVMINLINNALDAVSDISGDREIRIELSCFEQSRVRIRVTNNGPLIPPEILDRIFVPFFTTKKNGSGIGLSICQEIIKLHQGSLTVVSSINGHTSFIIEI